MGMLFDELSDDYLKSAGVLDILKAVPVPVAMDDNGNMTTLSIALAMARVIGGDPNYPYSEQYLRYIDRITGDNTVPFLVAEGAHSADAGKFEEACMYLRAALDSDPKSRDALYLYGRACKGAYEAASAVNEGSEEANGDVASADEKYVGSFKAESIEAFELLTVLHPKFAMGYYFLGYSYLNLGLYTKAVLTWREFMELIEDDDTGENRDELKQEIEERLNSLEEPVMIEQAVNRILAGDYQGGKSTLDNYREGRYSGWWPLWFYLGISEAAMNDTESAIKDFKHALVYSPSNIEVMQELVAIYEALGDTVNAEKYRKKIEIVSE